MADTGRSDGRQAPAGEARRGRRARILDRNRRHCPGWPFARSPDQPELLQSHRRIREASRPRREFGAGTSETTIDNSQKTEAPTPAWVDRLTEFLLRNRLLLFALAWVVTLITIWPSTRLTLDESIESFFAESDPLLKNYVASKQAFGADEFVLVAYSADPPLIKLEGHSDETPRVRLNPVVLRRSV